MINRTANRRIHAGANEAVARELKKRAVPTIYRIHENPDPEKLGEYREFVLGFNTRLAI